jgi:hypothetical protein
MIAAIRRALRDLHRPECSREVAGHKCQRNLPQGCECGRGTADGIPRTRQGIRPSLYEGKK